MATVRQKRLAQAIVENMARPEPKNKKELLVSVGYTPTTADVKQREMFDRKGVKDELAALGFTEENAMKVVSEILLKEEAQDKDRLKAAEQIFKVHGTYAPEKSINMNYNLSEEHKARAKNAIKQLFSGGDT